MPRVIIVFQILDELQTSIPSMADIDEESEASITEVCFFYFIFLIEIHFHGKNLMLLTYIFSSDAKNYSKSRRNEKPKAFVV